MRRLGLCVAMLALAACGAPSDEDDKSSGFPADPNAARADIGDRPYAGEWAAAPNECDSDRKIWTIEAHRMGMQEQRFCVFDKIYMAENKGEGEAWSASAKCLAEGKESHDFVFFRVKANLHEMRVTINDANAVDLVRCPSRT